MSKQKRLLPAGPVERNETPLIDPRDPTPAYHQMRRTLEEWIAVGRYDIGARLPSESELCTVFGVSRITVRKALGQIAKAGWIAREQGRGSFVRKVPGAWVARTVEIGVVTLVHEPSISLERDDWEGTH